MTTPWKAFGKAESMTSFSILNSCSQRFSVFSKFGQNEPKGLYFGLKWSNQPKIVCCHVEMADFCEKQQNFAISG